MNVAKEQELDIRGMMAPFGLLKVTLAFEGLETGGILKIKVGDRSTVDDILKVLKRFAYLVLDVSQRKDYFTISLRKNAGSGTNSNRGKSPTN